MRRSKFKLHWRTALEVGNRKKLVDDKLAVIVLQLAATIKDRRPSLQALSGTFCLACKSILSELFSIRQNNLQKLKPLPSIKQVFPQIHYAVSE